MSNSKEKRTVGFYVCLGSYKIDPDYVTAQFSNLIRTFPLV